MFGLGFVEMLILLLGGTGTLPDFAAALDPTSYFADRRIEVTIAKMTELAGQEPNTAPAQVRQLLALRYLAAHPDQLKKAEDYAAHRQTLEAVAAGQRAQDAQGFAKEYAASVLARLDNKPPPVPAAPKLREDALAWFPADATLVGALDTRVVRAQGGTNPGLSDVLKKLPALDWKAIYAVVDQTGNLRLDRLAFAYVHHDQRDQARLYFRATGKGNPAWLLAAIKDKLPQVQLTERKDATGQPIQELRFDKNSPPALLLGDRDFIIAGTMGNEQNADAGLEMFAIRAGKKPSATSGPLKTRLRKVPDRALALLIGDLPGPLANELKGMLGVAPTKVDAFVEALQPGLDVSVIGTMSNAADAQAAVLKLSKLRKDGIDMLQALQKQPNANRQVPVNALVNLVQSLQMQAEGNEVRLRVLIPRDILQGLPLWFGF